MIKNYLESKHRKLYFFILRIRTYLTIPLRSYYIKKYLNQREESKLHIGAGRIKLNDWLNTDFIAKLPDFLYLNVAKKFPFEDESFNYIYNEHLIEHIDYESAFSMLKECFRCLKKDGILRVETPDLKIVANIYNKIGEKETDEYIKWHFDEYATPNTIKSPCFAMNNNMRNWGHQFVFDEETLTHLFNKAGFRKIKRCEIGVSKHSVLNNISGRKEIPINRYETLVLEAVK